jgi:XTP/dITP diphosphohydrolase
MKDKKFLLGSNNAGKLAELRRILHPLGIDLCSPADLGIFESPVEDGESFEDNALIKAKYFSKLSGLPAIADDSGLCVDALDGAPGVRSARFAGEQATDSDNNSLLIEKLKSVSDEDRKAHFHCSAVCVFPNGEIVTAAGRVDGLILREQKGAQGFGYDPLFWEPVTGRAFAELDGEQKDSVSHRGRAFRALAKILSKRMSDTGSSAPQE